MYTMTLYDYRFVFSVVPVCFALALGAFEGEAEAKRPVIAHEVELGRGFDRTKRSYRAFCLRPCSGGKKAGRCQLINTGTARMSANIQVTRSLYRKHLESALSLSVDAKAVKLSLELAYLRSESKSALVLSFYYLATFRLHHQMLTGSTLYPPYAKLASSNAALFQKKCGDAFVQQRAMGGKLFLALVFRFRTREKKRQFRLRFSAKVFLKRFSKSLDRYKAIAEKDTKLSIRFHQVGGRPASLSSIRKQMKQALERGCTFSRLAPCQKALSLYLRYARSQFPKDVRSNPAVLGFKTAPYSYVGVFTSTR